MSTEFMYNALSGPSQLRNWFHLPIWPNKKTEACRDEGIDHKAQGEEERLERAGSSLRQERPFLS